MMRLLTLAILLIAGRGLSAVAIAQSDFFSSSPGELTKSHAEFDNQQKCNECHVNGTREVSNQQCLNCHDHKDLGARIAQGKGFHASALVKGKKCETCHSEHKKRTYDLMGWNKIQGGQKGFDHDLTGWPLKGKHSSTDCTECHKAKNKQGLQLFMGTDRLCGTSGCHGDDQPHKFQRKDMLVCDRCHGESVWKPAKPTLNFNHDDRKDAAMPILGSHKDVACLKCHPKTVFNLPAQDPDGCGNTGCHKTSHEGHLFNTRACEWCHSPTFKNFKQQYNRDMPFFDHSERTRFDLGAHKKLKCYECHTPKLGEAKPVGSCEQCHAKDNKHGNRFDAYGSPPKCQTCHTTNTFKRNIFNHDSRTKFALKFQHADQTCRGCHRGKTPAEFERFPFDPNKECMSCHAHAKVHSEPSAPNGKYKNNQCLGCHLHPGDPTIRQGKDNKIVDEIHGSKGSFPLVKSHKGVPCADCHTGRDKKGKTSFSGLKPNCNAAGQCHEDSLHKGTLGADKCTSCHVSGTWDALLFDHNVKVFPDGTPGYELKGEHKNNKCESCHGAARKFKDTPRDCSASGCHAEDDAHKGRLGTKCEQCHLETGDNLFNHNTMSVFHLDGKHLDVRCSDCHPSVTFKPRPTTCFGCHPEPAVHKGQYGTTCEQCHTTRTWDDIKPLHDVGDFALRGMHDNIACERCHRDNRPLAGSGNLCINCHRQDDIHNNSLSPKCGECHTQWSFTPARFDHSRVGCNLIGLHRTLACFDCHKNGNFSAITPECTGCHLDDARNRGPGHAGRQTYCTGSGCHQTNSWTPNVGMYPSRESVCR
ncbi:MAG: hypothetical protein M3680_05200 [Myxococcota bacterium]|nr:hypothetical protein [Myxococcota bacterium]